MAKFKDVNDSKAVSDFIKKLEPDFAKQVEAIRQLILTSDKEIGEHIKWNSPAFFYTGSMKDFDPKTYKRDMVIIHTRNEKALLVFPTGAAIKDRWNILEGDFTDGRKTITFQSMEDVDQKGKELQQVIKAWLAQVEK